MSISSKDNLTNSLVKVVVALSELHELVNEDKFALHLFEDNVAHTLALPMSLDDFIAEWQNTVNGVILDSTSLFRCWKKSVMFYKDVPQELKSKAHLDDNENLKGDDLVFEDGSYINTGVAFNNGSYILKFYVQISRDCVSFADFNEAAEYLWKNHAKEGYGV